MILGRSTILFPKISFSRLSFWNYTTKPPLSPFQSFRFGCSVTFNVVNKFCRLLCWEDSPVRLFIQYVVEGFIGVLLSRSTSTLLSLSENFQTVENLLASSLMSHKQLWSSNIRVFCVHFGGWRSSVLTEKWWKSL